MMGQQEGKSLIPGQVFQQVTIGSLPDNVLLEIFDFYQVFVKHDGLRRGDELLWAQNWDKLVHVCQRWRYVIFASPIRLNLQLLCTNESPVRKLLDVWPPFPLVIRWSLRNSPVDQGFDNFIAALEHRDRVCQISITNTDPEDSLWEEIVTAMAMNGPFPALRSLSLASNWSNFHFPNTFLNGSAPCLQHLTLFSISFPSLPRFLLSTTDLTSLHLFNIFYSWYLLPETMARCLSALPKLRSIDIHFKLPTSHPPRINRPVPETRFVLPALTRFFFVGASEYLEILATQIDAPLLDSFIIDFLTRPVFIQQTSRLLFGHLDSFMQPTLTLNFDLNHIPSYLYFGFYSSKEMWHSSRPWSFRSRRLDWQVMFASQICSQVLPFRSSVESLYIESSSIIEPFPGDEVDPTTWLQVFRSFTSVQSLTIPASLVPSIGAALQSLTGESAADSEVFPSLHSLSIVGDISEEAGQQGIESFVAARQYNGRPIAVSRREPQLPSSLLSVSCLLQE